MSAKINLKYFLKEFLITNKILDAHKGGEWGHFPLWQISQNKGPPGNFVRRAQNPLPRILAKL
jgi:hypothetical protein